MKTNRLVPSFVGSFVLMHFNKPYHSRKPYNGQLMNFDFLFSPPLSISFRFHDSFSFSFSYSPRFAIHPSFSLATRYTRTRAVYAKSVEDVSFHNRYLFKRWNNGCCLRERFSTFLRGFVGMHEPPVRYFENGVRPLPRLE